MRNVHKLMKLKNFIAGLICAACLCSMIACLVLSYSFMEWRGVAVGLLALAYAGFPYLVRSYTGEKITLLPTRLESCTPGMDAKPPPAPVSPPSTTPSPQ